MTGAIAIGQEAGGKAELILHVVPLKHLWLAACALCLLIGLPMLVYPGEVNAWARILSERGGGLSLSRVQLALWAGSLAVIYLALSIPAGRYPQDVPPEFWQLLLVAGATSAISLPANRSLVIPWTELKLEAISVITQLKHLADVPRKLPISVVTEVNQAKAGLDTGGDWPGVKQAVQKAYNALIRVLGRRGEGLLPAENIAFAQLHEVPESGPSSEEATAIRAALDELYASDHEDSGAQKRDGAPPEGSRTYLTAEKLTIEDLPGFVGTVQDATSAVMKDLGEAHIAVDPSVLASVEKLKAQVAMLSPQSPKLSDMVENWNGEGDFSRVQYLLLTVGAVAIFLLQFLRTATLPVVPPELLYILGASQATYLGVKWAQKLRSEESMSGSPGA